MIDGITEIAEASAIDAIEIIADTADIVEVVTEETVLDIIEDGIVDVVEIIEEVVVATIEIAEVPEAIIEILDVGNPGAPGRQGPPGPAGAALLTYIAGEVLSGHRIVIIENDKAYYASNMNSAHANRIAGITIGATMYNDPAYIQTGGELEEPSWNWVLNIPLWLSASGFLTQIPPTVGFSCIIGSPVTSTKILINIGTPISLV